MKKSFLLGLLFPVLILSVMVTPVFAESPASGSSQTTQLQYTIGSGEGTETTTNWTWKVPATQTFTITDLERNGTVSIGPATEGKFLVMDNGTTINIKLNSANGFKLMTNAGEKSTIPYQIKKNGTTNSLVQNTNVLSFTAGQSSNTGVSQELIFFTDEDSMKNPTLIGTHTDTITFRAQVTPPPGAVFSNGTRLAWNQLKLAENGTKYGYDASAVTDTSIGANAFKSRRSLTSITIPSSVTSIGKYAFDSCENLASVAFEGGSQLTSIGESAFQNCYSLTSITIPDSLTSIGISAFQYCHRLTSITIPNSVISIGYGVYGAFHCCNSLTEINVDANNQNYSSVDGVLFNKEKNTLIQYPAGKTGSYTIPDSVTSIRDYAFWYCTNLTSINIPNSVQSVGDLAFGSCSKLTSITIPSSVTSIGTRAFDSCSNLTDINYNGTQDQWNAITFGTNWNVSTGNYTIHCTDGDIAKS